VVKSREINKWVKRSHTLFGRPEIEVHVKEARRLIAADKNGKSDPYCVVSYSGVEEKTAKVMATVAPKWNFSKVFPFVSADEPIKFKVSSRRFLVMSRMRRFSGCILKYVGLD
jgi:Ca2+-dependent lipid-binding protein